MRELALLAVEAVEVIGLEFESGGYVQ